MNRDHSLVFPVEHAGPTGIAIAAFVRALFLTPALTALIGHAAWWPGHGDDTQE